MTCKECLCYEVCQHKWAYSIFINIHNKIYMEGMEKKCEFFKPKSRFVELPCEVGSTVYVLDEFVDNEECCECEHYCVGGFGDPSSCGRTRYGFKHPDCIKIVERTAKFGDILRWITPSIFTEKIDFGKTVFLSKDEAENALKERDKE